MSGRGRQTPLVKRPTTPPASDSLLVDKQKLFSVQSIGPGADTEIKSKIRSLQVLKRIRPLFCSSEMPDRILDAIENEYRMEHWSGDELRKDPTWGFCVFVTSFTQASVEGLPRALENWVKVQQRQLRSFEPSVYDEELCRRFKLDVISVQDHEGASDDRIREEFRAFMRGLRLNYEDDEDMLGHLASMRACLVLDAKSIVELAELTGDERLKDLERVTVRAIDCGWKRKTIADSDHTYRGVGDVSIIGLADLFDIITKESGFMEGCHPMKGMPEFDESYEGR